MGSEGYPGGGGRVSWGALGGAVWGFGCGTGGLVETHDDTGFGTGPETHDDTGLVLNEKPMMTETPQTRKIFFLKKKLDPEKFFLEFFFWGGLANPCHHGFWLIQTLTCHAVNTYPPAPFDLPIPPTVPPVSWSPHVPPTILAPPTRVSRTRFFKPNRRVIVGWVNPWVSWGHTGVPGTRRRDPGDTRGVAKGVMEWYRRGE